MKSFLGLFCICVFVLFGCTNDKVITKGQSFVLPYSAFGPPSMSGQLLGNEWYQWLPHGDSRPREYPVNVVVYRDISLLDIQNLYPVNQTTESDFRYIMYSEAIGYFDYNLQDLMAMEEEGFPMGRLSKELSDIKKLLINEFNN